MTQNTSKKKIMGFAAVVGASLLFGCGYSLGSVIEAAGMSKTCNSLWTTLTAAALIVLLDAVRGRNPFRRVTKLQLTLCVLCGVCTTWLSNFLFLFSYQYLSVSEATMLHFLHPSMIAVFMTLAFKERFSLAKLAAIVCSIAGMMLITGGVKGGALIGIAAAVATGILYGAYLVLLEVSVLKDVESTTLLLYMNLSGAVCAAIVSTCSGTFSLPINATVWGCDVVLSASNFLAYLLSAYAVHALGATNTSFGAMLEPIASCAIAALFLGQGMQINVLYAGILILLSVFFCSLNNRPTTKRLEKQHAHCAKEKKI